MRALTKYENKIGCMRIEEVDEPNPSYDQVKIKVKSASICSSDMLYYKGGDQVSSRLRVPVILGHEGSGIVTELGEGVHHVKVGDRVVAETTLETCQECEACLEGRLNKCPHRKGLGSSANGFFAEYVLALGRSVHKIPDNLSFDGAALLEPFTCAVKAVLERSRVEPYHYILVSGPGPIGLFTAQTAKLCGATVILSGTTRGIPRLELAKRLGVDHVINSNSEDMNARVLEITKNRGVDVAYECSGAIPSINSCIDALKPNGTYVWLGAMHGGNNLDFRYNEVFASKELTMVGAVSTNPSSWNKSMRLVEQNKVHLEELVTHRLPLESWEEGFGMVASREAIKVVFNP